MLYRDVSSEVLAAEVARDGLMGWTHAKMAELARDAAADWRREAKRLMQVGDRSGYDWAMKHAAECDKRAEAA
jgi:hypothetical protein